MATGGQSGKRAVFYVGEEKGDTLVYTCVSTTSTTVIENDCYVSTPEATSKQGTPAVTANDCYVSTSEVISKPDSSPRQKEMDCQKKEMDCQTDATVKTEVTSSYHRTVPASFLWTIVALVVLSLVFSLVAMAVSLRSSHGESSTSEGKSLPIRHARWIVFHSVVVCSRRSSS